MSSCVIKTKFSGDLTFYIEGTRSTNEVAIMTVHDLGCNHNQYLEFLKHPSMAQLAPRCVWFNVDLPGQGTDDEDLPADFEYPTMQQICEDLIDCISALSIPHLILFGEGAGANILARMAMSGEERVLGAVLLNCVGSTHTFMEALKDKVIGWRLSSIGMNTKTENYLVMHRFGLRQPKALVEDAFCDAADLSLSKSTSDADLCSQIDGYKSFVRKTINAKNLHGYVNSYMNRSNLVDKRSVIKCPILFITGSLANHFYEVKNLYEEVQNNLRIEPDRKRLVELMEVDECANVLIERTDRVAESLQYFLQGIGLVSSVPSRRMSNTIRPPVTGRKISMEEYDAPKGVNNITFNPTRKYSEGEPM